MTTRRSAKVSDSTGGEVAHEVHSSEIRDRASAVQSFMLGIFSDLRTMRKSWPAPHAPKHGLLG